MIAIILKKRNIKCGVNHDKFKSNYVEFISRSKSVEWLSFSLVIYESFLDGKGPCLLLGLADQGSDHAASNTPIAGHHLVVTKFRE